MLAVHFGREPEMRAALPHNRITEFAQSVCRNLSRHVVRQFHKAKSSSRTKCNQIIPGGCCSEKCNWTASRINSRSSSRLSALRVDAVAKSRCVIASIRFVLGHFENDFAYSFVHSSKLSVKRDVS